MTLAIPIIILLFGLYLIGEFVPSYPATTKKPPTYSAPPDSKGWAVLSTMPDLRVSEFAPDADAAYIAESDWFIRNKAELSHREKVKYIKAKLEKEESRTERRNKSIRDQQAAQKQDYLRYHDEIQEIKARRMREGNPVTKKNPIDPDEMPREPYRPLFHY